MNSPDFLFPVVFLKWTRAKPNRFDFEILNYTLIGGFTKFGSERNLLRACFVAF